MKGRVIAAATTAAAAAAANAVTFIIQFPGNIVCERTSALYFRNMDDCAFIDFCYSTSE
jgi:hypothetical protein